MADDSPAAMPWLGAPPKDPGRAPDEAWPRPGDWPGHEDAQPSGRPSGFLGRRAGYPGEAEDAMPAAAGAVQVSGHGLTGPRRLPGRDEGGDETSSAGAGKGPGHGLAPSAIWWLLPGMVAALLLSGVGAAVGQALTGRSNSAVTDLLGEVGLWAAMFGTVSFASRRQGTSSLKSDFGLARLALKDVIPAFGAMVLALVVSEIVVEAFAGTRFSGSNTQIITSQRGHEASLVVVSVLVAVGAPFFEELFFRGYLRVALQRALERLLARRSEPERLASHGGVWLQAALFGLAHFGEASTVAGNLSVVMAMFLVGAVLGYTARATGRLGPGMIAHGAFNLLAVISVV